MESKFRALAVLGLVGSVLLGTFEAVVAADQGSAVPQVLVSASLVAKESAPSPEGVYNVGVKFVMADGWHIYGKEPGELGLPTKVEMMPIEDVKVGELNWPATKSFSYPGVPDSHGYDGTSTISFPVTGKSLAGKELTVATKWLACSKDACIPGKSTLKGVVGKDIEVDPGSFK